MFLHAVTGRHLRTGSGGRSHWQNNFGHEWEDLYFDHIGLISASERTACAPLTEEQSVSGTHRNRWRRNQGGGSLRDVNASIACYL